MTGGDEDSAMAGLKQVYLHPEVYGVLPFKHRFNAMLQDEISAFFIPCYKAVYEQGYIDKRGYCDEEKAKAYYDREREKRAASPQALLDYSAEFCYTALEAFSKEGQNNFNKIIIAEQLTRITVLKDCPKVETGMFRFAYKDSDHTFNNKNVRDVIWYGVQTGKVLILEHPIWMKKDSKEENIDHTMIDNLYVGGCDGIDIDMQQTSSETRNASDFCLIIFKRHHGLHSPMPVAIYKNRPERLIEAYLMSIALAIYYNAIINIEATRLSFLTWARTNGFLKYFMRRPSATYSDITKRRTNSYGTPATLSIINHQNDLIADYIEEYGENIWFLEMLELLNSYSLDTKRFHDIVVAFGMCLLADEELSGAVPRVAQSYSSEFQDFGYYYDENGYKHYGVIPKLNQFITNYTNNFYNEFSYRDIKTSDPRFNW